MGAPKQKWTPEEEAALRPMDFYIYDNVDLKDKWRNMGVMSNGCGSRDKARLALKRIHPASKHRASSMPRSSSGDDVVDARANDTSGGSSPNDAPERSVRRLDNLIMEAIRNLREPGAILHVHRQGTAGPIFLLGMPIMNSTDFPTRGWPQRPLTRR
ncbi:Telomere repeat-binding factor 1 [Striga hermonthica]|uniref:Telomere repeat-binding factor 1 n=1 Tax=Striga hermonthica TaxID=68872 RepID=A0A9N7MTX9_STRHE|nr:Telomere repeat-binding factor 1 [Striga hermonthica]